MRIQNCMATTMYRSLTERFARYVSVGKNRKTNKTRTHAQHPSRANQLSNGKHSRHRGRNETTRMAEEKKHPFRRD